MKTTKLVLLWCLFLLTFTVMLMLVVLLLTGGPVKDLSETAKGWFIFFELMSGMVSFFIVREERWQI